jgi:hypothetical protein
MMGGGRGTGGAAVAPATQVGMLCVGGGGL